MLEIANRFGEGQEASRLDGEKSFQDQLKQRRKDDVGPADGRARDPAARAELREAIRSGDTSKALALIRTGASPYSGTQPAVKDPARQTSDLIFAAANGEAEVVRAILEPLTPQERAQRINERGPGGNTALHAAAFGHDAETIDYLRTEGGDDRLTNDAGQTPGEIPPHLQKRFLGLLVAGAALGLAFEAWAHGRAPAMKVQPLDVANHTAPGLLADVAAGRVAAVEALLRKSPAGFDINQMNDKGETALHLALQGEGSMELVSLLVRHGADASVLDGAGKSAFDLAYDKARSSGDTRLQRVAQYLRDGLTQQLRIALAKGDEPRALALIEGGASGEGRFRNGSSMLEVAALRGMTRVVDAILAACRPRRALPLSTPPTPRATQHCIMRPGVRRCSTGLWTRAVILPPSTPPAGRRAI